MSAAVIRRGWLYLADLNPQRGTEPGKVRPVLVLQSDLLNNLHPSTVVVPLTTKVHKEASHLRVHLKKGEAGLEHESDVLLDQVRAVDNRRFIQPIGPLSKILLSEVEKCLLQIMDIDTATESL